MAFKIPFDDDPSPAVILSQVQNFEEITDVRDIVIQICYEGICTPANGYVKYGTNSASLGKCTKGNCIPNVDLDIINGCKTTAEVGNANYDSTTSTLSICTIASTTSETENELVLYYQFETITPSKDNFLRVSVDASTKYSRYSFDNTGNAIAIYNSHISEGYYVIHENTINTNPEIINDNTLLLCTATNGCLSQTTVGYYINAGNPNTELLDLPYIQYASDGTCGVITNPVETECKSETVGKLLSTGELCLGASDDKNDQYKSYGFAEDATTANYYVIANENETNTFNKETDNYGQLNLIKINNIAMILEMTEQSSKCLVTKTLKMNMTISNRNECDGSIVNCISGICTVKEIPINCKFSDATGNDCT